MEHPWNYLNLRREAAQPANLAAVPATMPSPCMIAGADFTLGLYTIAGHRAFLAYAPASATAMPQVQATTTGTAVYTGVADGGACTIAIASQGASPVQVFVNSVQVGEFNSGGLGITGKYSGILTDATNNSLSAVLDLTRKTSGAPVAGIGTRIYLRSQTDAGGTVKVATALDSVMTNVGAGTESSRCAVSVVINNTLTPVMNVGADGFALVRDIGVAHVANGMIGSFHLAQTEGGVAVDITNSYVKVGAVVLLQACALDPGGVTQIVCPVATVAGKFTVVANAAVAAAGGLDVSFLVVNPPV